MFKGHKISVQEDELNITVDTPTKHHNSTHVSAASRLCEVHSSECMNVSTCVYTLR